MTHPSPTGDALPEPACVRDAVLGPLVPASTPPAIGCRARTAPIVLEHLRGDTPGGVIDVLEIHPVDDDPDMPRIAGPALYAGPLFTHFGHMLAEGIHRLWAATAFPPLADATIVFQGDPAQAAPAWLTEVLGLCGIAPERLLVVRRPTLFAQLWVPKQGRVLGGEILIRDYARLFPLAPIVADRTGSDRLYLSRSRHIHGGTYLGESLIDARLAAAGFEVIHPQEMATAALVRKLAGAALIVLAEGSAIHNLELCGRVAARLFVIGRRIGTKRRFGRLLESLAREWRIFAGTPAPIGLDWDEVADRPRPGRSCSFIDIAALIGAIGEFAGISLEMPDAATIDRAIAADLLRFLIDPRSGAGASDAQLGHALRMLRAMPAVAGLLEDSRRAG